MMMCGCGDVKYGKPKHTSVVEVSRRACRSALETTRKISSEE